MHRSIDGIQPRPLAEPQHRIAPQRRQALQTEIRPVAAPLTPEAAKPASKAVFQPPARTSHRPSFRERMQTPLIIMGCAVAGIFSQSLWFGLAAIAAYSICTFIFRINSRTTFSLAFISLVTVVLLLVVKQDAAAASNFATYTFLLLVLGVIALSFEARPQHRRKRRNGR